MKKLLCLLLAMLLLVSSLSQTAFAADEEEDDWTICCWLGDEAGADPDQLQCVVVYTNHKFVIGGWRSWLEVVFMDKDGTYVYISEAVSGKFFSKPDMKKIAENDPYLQTIYPVMEDYMLNRFSMTFYEENLADKTDQQIALGTLQEMFEEWVDDLVFDTLNEVCFSSAGVAFGIDDVLGTLYSESMDLEGVLEEMGADGKIAEKLEKWLKRLFSLLFAIERHRPSGETIANITVGDIAVDSLTMRSQEAKEALHESVRTLATEHGQFIPRNE